MLLGLYTDRECSVKLPENNEHDSVYSCDVWQRNTEVHLEHEDFFLISYHSLLFRYNGILIR